MRSRAPAALALSALLAAAAHPQAPPPAKDAKDPPETSKSAEPKWLTEINGKTASEFLKEVNHPDPAVREAALKALPVFGPNVRKEAGKMLLARMKRAVDGGEKDPGVRITLFNTVAAIGFEDKRDEAEAIRLLGLTVDEGTPGGVSRQHAVVTLGMIGSKAGGAITFLTGRALSDPSYQIRLGIARSLGQIGFDDKTGPNLVALRALSATLARDVSVAVRMEALQSLVVLGPPWAAPLPPDGKGAPVINKKGADEVAENMRVRLGLVKSPVPPEADAQVEIWCRVVLMRFDPKEVGDANLAALARHLAPTAPAGPKVQALQALALFGEASGPRLDDVVRMLEDNDPLVLSTTLSSLAAMGVEARGAIPELEKAEKKLAKMLDDRLKEPEVQKVMNNLKTEKEREQALATFQEEQARRAVVAAIKWIKDSKPGQPGGDRPAGPGGTGAAATEPKKP